MRPLDIVFNYHEKIGSNLTKDEIQELLFDMTFWQAFEYTKMCIKELGIKIPENLIWLYE